MPAFTFHISLYPVPCGPYVHSHLDCQSQVLTIGWNASHEAQGYITVISDGTKKMSYNTTKPALSVKTLECGQDYTVKVMSVNGTCVSRPTVLPVRESKSADVLCCPV